MELLLLYDTVQRPLELYDPLLGRRQPLRERCDQLIAVARVGMPGDRLDDRLNDEPAGDYDERNGDANDRDQKGKSVFHRSLTGESGLVAERRSDAARAVPAQRHAPSGRAPSDEVTVYRQT